MYEVVNSNIIREVVYSLQGCEVTMTETHYIGHCHHSEKRDAQEWSETCFWMPCRTEFTTDEEKVVKWLCGMLEKGYFPQYLINRLIPN